MCDRHQVQDGVTEGVAMCWHSNESLQHVQVQHVQKQATQGCPMPRHHEHHAELAMGLPSEGIQRTHVRLLHLEQC